MVGGEEPTVVAASEAGACTPVPALRVTAEVTAFTLSLSLLGVTENGRGTCEQVVVQVKECL